VPHSEARPSSPKALICGTFAYDTIMIYSGRYRDHLRPEAAHVLDLSFPYEQIRTDFGGCGANVSYHLRQLGMSVLPLATVGVDFEPYSLWLDQQLIPRRYIQVIEDEMTARAYIMTDLEDSQLTAFHSAASAWAHNNSVAEALAAEARPAPEESTGSTTAEPPHAAEARADATGSTHGSGTQSDSGAPGGSAAHRVEVGDYGGFAEYEEPELARLLPDPHKGVSGEPGPVTIGMITPDDPRAMMVHAVDFAAAEVPFLFDPGQQIGSLSPEELLHMIDRSTWLALNEYEAELVSARTGLARTELAAKVEALIVTRGRQGSTIWAAEKELTIEAVPSAAAVDPTGAGDAYRAGLLFGIMRGYDWPLTGRIASLMGAMATEHFGAQGLYVDPEEFQQRFDTAFL